MKRINIFFSAVLGSGLLLLGATASASTFPNNAISFYQDLTPNTTVKQLLLATSTRTLLYATITQQKIDVSLKLFCDNTELVETNFNLYSEVFLSADCLNKPIYAQITPLKNTQVSVHLTYTEYDLSATSTPILITNFPPVQNVFVTNWEDVTTGTSTTGGTSTITMTDLKNIETIGYTAIETNLGNGQVRIDGQYIIPFWLFVFVFLIFAMVLWIAKILLIDKK